MIRAIGQQSYEIYLTHMFVVFTTVALFRASGANVAFVAIWYAGALVASVLLGWLVARWYSVPLNDALRARLFGSAKRLDLPKNPAPGLSAGP